MSNEVFSIADTTYPENIEKNEGITRKEFIIGAAGAAISSTLAGYFIGKFAKENKEKKPHLIQETYPGLEGLEAKQRFSLELQLSQKRTFEIVNFTDYEINEKTLSEYLEYVILISESGWKFKYEQIPGVSIDYQVVPEHKNQQTRNQILILPKGRHPIPQWAEEFKLYYGYTLPSPITPETLSVIPAPSSNNTESDLLHIQNGLATEICQAVATVEQTLNYEGEDGKEKAEAYLEGMFKAEGEDIIQILGKEVLCNSLGTAISNHMIGKNDPGIGNVTVYDRFTNTPYKLINIPSVFYDYMPSSDLPPIVTND